MKKVCLNLKKIFVIVIIDIIIIFSSITIFFFQMHAFMLDIQKIKHTDYKHAGTLASHITLVFRVKAQEKALWDRKYWKISNKELPFKIHTLCDTFTHSADKEKRSLTAPTTVTEVQHSTVPFMNKLNTCYHGLDPH